MFPASTADRREADQAGHLAFMYRKSIHLTLPEGIQNAKLLVIIKQL